MKTRNYRETADLEAMITLLGEVRPASWGEHYPAAGDLRELFCVPAIQNNTRLWFDDTGCLAAYAFVDPYHNVWFEGRELEPLAGELFAWATEVLLRDLSAEPDQVTLDTNCRADDLARAALLEAHGFQRDAVTTLRLERSLAGDLPAAELPGNFSVRELDPEEDLDAFYDLHCEAFGDDYLPVEEAGAILRGTGASWVAPLGLFDPYDRLVGYAICWCDDAENARHGRRMGAIDPLAVHPDVRGRGLARTLLALGLARLREQGLEVAGLGTSSDNPAMAAAARAAGFEVVQTKLWYSKNVT